MKIGIDARLINTAGVRRYLEGIMSYLPELDGDNQYFIYFPTQEHIDRYCLDMANVKQIVLPADCYGLREQWSLPSRIIVDGLDIFHATYDFCIPIIQPCKLVVTIHDAYITPDDGQYFRSYLTKLYGQLMTRYAVKTAAQLITISEFVKKKLLQVCPQNAGKITVIPNGVESEFRQMDDSQVIGRLKRKYHLPPHYILYLGSFKLKKNLPRLIEAFTALPQKIQQEYPLVLAGKPTYFI